MINLIDYLKITNQLLEPISTISKANYLKSNYFDLSKKEKKSLLHFIHISNFCKAFETRPIVYEQVIQYLSDKFKIEKRDITLIGSARTGFAIDPTKYGKPFSKNSDLDFTIINETLFNQCKKDFKLWKKNSEESVYSSETKSKYPFWNDNINGLKYNIKSGFIDTYKIPNFSEFKTTQALNNSLSLIVINLKKFHTIEVSQASVRVYRDWETFEKRLITNVESVLKKV